jgi:hypothetical protein
MRLERLQARRDAATSLKQSSSVSPYSGPPCCGAGCAVCALDYWEPDEFENPTLEKAPEMAMEIGDGDSNHGRENHPCDFTNKLTQSDSLTALPDNSPVCCGAGCAVCVLDYPEYFSEQRSEAETLAMVEAIEKAQQQVERMIASQGGNS